MERLERNRELCRNCLRSPENCYCSHLRRFDPGIRFIILHHAREAQKHIATGRIAYLCLEGSELIYGCDYDQSFRVAEIISDARTQKVVLFPGVGSTNLSELGTIERSNLFLREIDLVVFVIDGTWSTAKKTMLHCETLAPLPRISFDVTTPSQIRIRQQPAPHCITTAEAIHQTIEILGPSRGFDISTRTHDVLLHTQEAMVSKQVALAKRHYPAYWG